MTGERIIPGGAALEAFHTLGSDNWHTDMDANLLKMAGGLTSVLVVKSQVTVLPGSPTLGDIYIVKDGETNEKDIAIWDGPVASEAWNYFPAFEGLKAYPLDTKAELLFDGTDWVAAGGGASKILQVGRSSNLSISNSTNTVAVFNDEMIDTENIWDVGTNPTRLLALGNGLHRVSAHVEWDLLSPNLFFQHIFTLNRAGSTTFNVDFDALITEGTSPDGANISRHIRWDGVIDLLDTDYIELLLWQSSGAARNLGNYTEVTLEFLG